MDSRDNFSNIDSTYRLLALCARAESHPLMLEELTRQLKKFTAWGALPIQAELHGMAPLLWHHIHQTEISLPLEVERTLGGLYLRHREFNRVHTQALLKVNSLFEKEGIRVLVLKGLALAYEYYPDPALRPFSDIDLLLQTTDMLTAVDLLAAAGFHVDSAIRAARTRELIPKELVIESPLQDGLCTRLELHHYDPRQKTLNDNTRDDEFTGFDSPSHPLIIEEQSIYVPAPMDTLNYLDRHLKRHLFESVASKPLQLKWVADIISLVERHAEMIDWGDLQRRNPSFLQRLEVFYSLTPMPERFAKLIPVQKISQPSGINHYPQGWPQNRFQDWKKTNLLKFILQTFAPPSVWWLRLYYGVDEQSTFWYGQIFHRLRVLKILFWVIIRKLNFQIKPNL